ncbi:MAG: SNF2-related protein [Chitinophagaceae bacterium]
MNKGAESEAISLISQIALFRTGLCSGSLSHIIKHIYNYASDEVVRRGKRIFLTQGVKFLRKDELSGQLHFKVRNDQYHNHYNVAISKYQDEQTLTARCQCPYNMGEICRHEAAALFHLNDMLLNQELDQEQARFNQAHTMIRMRSIDLKHLRLFTSNALFEEAEKIQSHHKVEISHSVNEKVEALITVGQESFSVKLQRNDDKSFDTSCTCEEHRHPLCPHKTALFLQLLHASGPNFFDSIRNWDHQKNKLLGLYGYSLSDDLNGKFDFYYQDGKPFLKVLDQSIKKVQAQPLGMDKPATNQVVGPQDYNKRLGLIIHLQEKQYPFFGIDLVEGDLAEHQSAFSGQIQKLDTGKYINPEKYPLEDRELINMVRKIQRAEFSKHIARNSPFGDIWENIITQDADQPDQESLKLIFDYLHPKLLRMFNQLSPATPLYFLPNGLPYRTSSLKEIKYLHHNLYPNIHVRRNPDYMGVDISLIYDDASFLPEENALQNHLLYLHGNLLLLIHKPGDAARLADLSKKTEIPLNEWSQYLHHHIVPISKLYDITFDEGLVEYHDESTPKTVVYISEQNNYFMIKPMFRYGQTEVEISAENHISVEDQGKLVYMKRNKAHEQVFIDWINELHPHLRKPEYESHFALHGKYVFSQNWFFQFFDKMKEADVDVFGYENLKNFRINKSKPNTSVHISSNLDWFDTEIEINFDGLGVDVSDIQKALSLKQNYVALGDGSIGILPEEWLKKFSLLFKMADTQGKKLRVSKFNFSVIDEMMDLISDQDIIKELDEKKKLLLNENPESHSDIAIPEEINAVLRPYQVAGFQWLAYLEKVKWGGLLADDMGLGKTVQTLTFLQYYKTKNQGIHALVICPTSLLYNWENEIRKFAPQLSYLIHHGSSRTLKHTELSGYDIIISTYGTLRSDAELFAKNEVDYIVLDESQTIKNPNSKVAKAAQFIPARNRIALSGTPMQNNTFDLYSQMNFLNPGMLGNKEFFKEQFAKPVDKFQDQETKDHLRKLVYPFMLRRTKEQVADDLPDKTDITLYCEMGPQQRAIYEAYKNMYRSRILGSIEQQGIEKSQFAILQGLMKLRQICDSPAILRDEQKFDNHSAKLDELTRELEENTGEHKVLIFSQFLGMLALIREKLKQHQIPFQYFDGSYTAIQREQAINEFQNNQACRVFLISLKAGGMGLNLTAADYVYIVDPWWNPAVEQQAIDRTHRIGQTKNIFAYRMICKDTVEEKIMLLKEKKNSLVKDIISKDQHMIKQLTRDDVSYLFS